MASPAHSETQKRIEAAAQNGYEGFCASPSPAYLPNFPLKSWAELPDVLKEAWRSAAARILGVTKPDAS